MNSTVPSHDPAQNELTVAFDTWILSQRYQNHGIHIYARQLLHHFRELAPAESIVIKPFVFPRAENAANEMVACAGISPIATRFLSYDRLWRVGGGCAAAWKQRQDLIFSPHYTTMYAGDHTPTVVTIHDVTPRFVEMESRRLTWMGRFFIWWATKFARALITDSTHSKADLVNLYGVPESNITVVYLGYDKAKFNGTPVDEDALAELRAKFGLTRPYVLHHGVAKSNKNLARLIEAFGLMKSRNRNLDLDLVLAGPLGVRSRELLAAASRSSAVPAKVILTQALSDDDLVTMLKGASLAVFPSLYEGFCLPMVEAMACGVPTVVSKTSCLPEISGGVLKYFDPYSSDDMASCMEMVLENESLRQELSAKAQQRARTFDWRRCAEETLKVFKRVGSEARV